ncbi:IDEAL domain-containing protein [Virgibacillus salarius]|uniref:IDEAL domain-containing protein n=1 Tax=Virgibacillus salarius TaxID=447199 RepID=UPI0024920D60|nr:IDEAL domain-containing protein [Virgibacillus salarius]WBX80142.1 IDEAL domain-containing protein [Virgibacillus salarius]
MRNADEFDALRYALLKSFKKEMGLIDYKDLEFGVETSVTDEDMLHIQINHALDTGNRELFLKLTDQLNNQPSLNGR